MKYKFDSNPICHEKCIVKGDKYRFCILTPRLVRMEFSDSGIYEDRATQAVVNRNFDLCDFECIKTEEKIQIETKYLKLTYKFGKFSPENLIVQSTESSSFMDWKFGEETNLIPGTTRTLDCANGDIRVGKNKSNRIILDKSMLSKDEIAFFDDSNTFAITDDGWFDKRNETTDVYIFAYGDDYLSAVKDYTYLTGMPSLLPRFALGNWWSRYYKYIDKEYLALMDKFAQKDIPFSVAVIDMDWHKTGIDPKYGSGWTGYSWNTELFPDYKWFLKELKNRNMKTTLNLHPKEGVAAHEDAYLPMAKELGVDYENEQTIEFDFTNKKFVEAYFKFLHHPMEDDGVDFWWMDWQQGTESKIKGLDPLWLLNHFHYLDSARKGNRPLIFSRFSGIGSQRYPLGFSGDTHITWESLDYQPYFTICASNVGYGWWSHDIGGHMQGYKDNELTIRWVQFGVFSPIMRLHSSNSDFSGKEPWNYGLVGERVISQFLRLRHKLIPYIYTMNYRAAKELIPLITPMYYYEKRADISNKNQYYFGDLMIVSPITQKGNKELEMGKTTVYLPKGYWFDFFSGARYNGGSEYIVYRTIDTMPVFVKSGGIVPLADDNGNDVSNPKSLVVNVYPCSDGTFNMYEDDGESVEYKNGKYAFTHFAIKDNVFSISAPVGDASVIPQNRTYRVIFKSTYESEIWFLKNGKNCEPCVEYDGSDLCVTFDLQSNENVEITLCNGFEYKEKDYIKEIFDILYRAEILYNQKTVIYDGIKNLKTKKEVLDKINSFDDISSELKQALLETVER